MAEDSTAPPGAAAKPAPRPIPIPKAPPPPKFGGYQVHIAGFAQWKQNDVVATKDLTRAGVDEDRLAQLVERGVLSEVWS